MKKLRSLEDLGVAGKRVLVRVDFNVPVQNGRVISDTRVRQAVPTLTELVAKGAKVIVASHMGRPKGEIVPELSLEPVAQSLKTHMPETDISFVTDTIGQAAKTASYALLPGQILVLENLRFLPGEECNDYDVIRGLAQLADLYVDDAFSCAHRAHASIEGIAKYLPSAAGRLMAREIDSLSRALENPARPLTAVIGGSKISTKLGILENLVTNVQNLVIGGAMANTFLLADGLGIGTSLCEPDMVGTVKRIRVKAEEQGCELILPSDAVTAPALEAGIVSRTVGIDEVPADQMILDLGPESVARLTNVFADSKTVIWNGPLGAFEVPPFNDGTKAAARQVAVLTASGELISIAGGGDTVAALEAAGSADDFSYVSMAGGAFLEWLEGRALPGVAVLLDG